MVHFFSSSSVRICNKRAILIENEILEKSTNEVSFSAHGT